MEQRLFREWAAIWLEQKRHLVKESTYANYSVAIVNHIVPVLGDQFIEKIDKKMVQEIIFQWVEKGRMDAEGGLSLKTVKDMTNILMMCLRDAKQDEKENFYNWKLVYPHREDGDNEVQVMCVEDTSRMLEIIQRQNSPEYVGYATGIYTGMRIGEICALKWEDIDLTRKCISVNKTLQRIYIKNLGGGACSKIIITSPKSKKSKRTIPMSAMLYELLRQTEREKNCYLITGGEHYMEPRVYRNSFKRFMRNNGLPDIRFHALRHTFATRCISMGTDYKTVSELLGHSSVSLTMNLYMHSQMEEKERCVNALSELYHAKHAGYSKGTVGVLPF